MLDTPATDYPLFLLASAITQRALELDDSHEFDTDFIDAIPNDDPLLNSLLLLAHLNPDKLDELRDYCMRIADDIN